jgi:hypothetical protein
MDVISILSIHQISHKEVKYVQNRSKVQEKESTFIYTMKRVRKVNKKDISQSRQALLHALQRMNRVMG